MNTTRRLFWMLTLGFWLGLAAIGRAAHEQGARDAQVAAATAATPTATTAATQTATTAPPTATAATKSQTATAATATRRITAAELARHARADDCWMAIGDGVYAITDYLPMHPSDESLLLPWCGRDATAAYRTKPSGQPHSARADKLLTRYRVGSWAGAGT